MNQKTIQRCLDLAGPILVKGERMESVEVLQIGRVSKKRQVGTAAVAGVLSGGLLMVAVKPRAYFAVLTNLRLLLIDNNTGSVGKKIVAAIPKSSIKAEQLRSRILTYTMDVTIDGAPQRFSWGRAGGADIAKRVATALGVPTP